MRARLMLHGCGRAEAVVRLGFGVAWTRVPVGGFQELLAEVTMSRLPSPSLHVCTCEAGIINTVVREAPALL